MRLLNFLLAITLLFSGFVLIADELPTGEVIEQVTCINEKSQSYAAYLPKDYNSGKKWPILYCFDSGTSGVTPVKLFEKIAEKYGFIVIGSNSVTDGPWAPIQKAVKAVWDDTRKRFSVDPKRVYATGFSEGARIAILLPYICPDQVAGVIACGGTSSVLRRPPSDMKWLFYGLVGNEDPFLKQLQGLGQVMNRMRILHKVKVFNGGHVWPQETACLEAIEWMNIQAMKTGRLAKDEKMLEELMANRMKKVDEFVKNQKPLIALAHCQEIKRDFNGLEVDFSKLNTVIQKLLLESKVKNAIAQAKKNQGLKKQAIQEFKKMVENLKKSKKRHKDVDDYIDSVKNETDPDVKFRKQWVLNYLLHNCFNAGNNTLQEDQYELAIINLKIAVQIKPDLNGAWYNLACAYSLLEKKEDAIKALKKAMSTGFNDIEHIKVDEDLDNIRREPEFLKLIRQK